jgi:hypothetical protein
MFRISKDSPAYYVTSVARNRLPVFRTATVENIAFSALDEARRSADFPLLTGKPEAFRKGGGKAACWL